MRTAFGLSAAFRRAFKLIWAICSRVVPYSCMWRRAYSDIQFGPENAPNGKIHCIIPVTPPASVATRSVLWRHAVSSLSARYTST